MKKPIAVIGGTFNPVNNMHLFMGQYMLNEFNIDKVIYLPTGDLYDKDDMVPAYHRVNMLRIALNYHPNMKISTYEADTKKLQYTIDTLNYLKNIYKRELIFVMGSDNLKGFSSWKNIKNLLSEYSFVIIERPGAEAEKIIKNDEILKEYLNKIVVRNTIPSSISSTYIRSLIGQSKSPRFLLPDKVYSYILKYNLYMV